MTISFSDIIYIGLLIILFSSCAEPVDVEKQPEINGLADLKFGTNSTFEIMTWNLEHFAKEGQTTVNYVAQVIFYLDIDVVGLQEIEDQEDFLDIVAELNELDSAATWIGYRAGSTSSQSQELAYVINTEWVTPLQTPYEIYQSEGAAFPREPFILELIYANQTIFIINNHLKAFDEASDRERRREASELLEQYIENNLAAANVIIVGDLNDEITDAEDDNVFWNFISQPNSYKFTDMNIANGSSSDFSYPTWPSHIDHILINAPLFDEFISQTSAVRVIKVDDYLDDGWSEYDQNISDHRPVAWRFTP